MKKLLLTALGVLFTLGAFAQVAYLQYRVVPNDRQGEFVEKETKYWAKVAETAIKNGKMTGWSLWRKVGITEVGAPNYVFVNNFENFEQVDMNEVWSSANEETMGVAPGMVETGSFAPTAFDYWCQLEDMTGGDYKFAVVNYAKPADLGGFIEENKSLWKPLHQGNINKGNMGMTSWGMLSVVHPKGKQARFSALTWDGFNTMADAMNWMRYQGTMQDPGFEKVVDKSKMGSIMPNGFEYTILYELVKRIEAE